MLVEFHRYKAARSSKLELIHLVLSGVGLTILVTVLSAVFVGYQISAYKEVNRKTILVAPLQAFTDLVVALNAESMQRVLDPTADYTELRQTSDTHFNHLLTNLQTLSIQTSPLEEAYRVFRDGNSEGSELLRNVLSILSESMKHLFALTVQRLTPRAKAAVRRLLTLRLSASGSSLASRLIYLHTVKSLPSFNRRLDVDEAIGFKTALANYQRAMAISIVDPVNTAHLELEEEAQKVFDGTYGLQAVGKQPFMVPTDSLDAMSTFLQLQTSLNSNSKDSASTALFMMAVALVMFLMAIPLTSIVTMRHNGKVQKTRSLIGVFESPQQRQYLCEQYLPLLQELRSLTLPHTFHSEIEREYLIAARHADTLRVTVPQLLFSRPQNKKVLTQTGSVREPWNILEESVNLQLGNTFIPTAVLMEIRLGSIEDTEQLGKNLGDELVRLSAIYNIVVSEVNRAGGIVMGFHSGTSITVAWNVTHIVSNGSLAALRTAWILEERLTSMPPDTAPQRVTICIASGRSILANQALGKRRCALLLSTAFFTINRMHVVSTVKHHSILINSLTHDSLGTEDLRSACKPVLVIRTRQGDGGGSYTETFFRADAGGAMDPSQSVFYHSAFVLYQNNMFTEAANQFSQYLTTYPTDVDAAFLRDHCNITQSFRLRSS